MINTDVVDAWFEQTKDLPCGPIRFAIFDKNVVIPLEQLAGGIETETGGEACTVDALRAKAAEGWFPLVTAPWDASQVGSHLYVPSRFELFFRLERQGWSSAELRLAAQMEEATIEVVTVKEDYRDDDLATLAAHLSERIDANRALEWTHGKEPEPRVCSARPTAEVERQLATIQKWQQHGIPSGRKETVAKHAYRVRAQNEFVALQMIEADRAKLRGGYGPVVQFTEGQLGPDAVFDPAHLDWNCTIATASAYAQATTEPPLIRVNGFLLRGDQVVPTRTLRPPEYDAAWERQRVDDYLRIWGRLQGERRCLHCVSPLPADSRDTRQFCSERCRNAEKMRRHRRENPQAVERAQEKYWNS